MNLNRMTRVVACLLGSILTAPGSTIYILDSFSSPANQTAPPFTLISNDGRILNLNGSQIATSTSSLPAGGVSVQIDFALPYSVHYGTIDSGEAGPLNASYYNTESGSLNDVGFFQEGSTDAVLNIDYSTGARVYFSVPAQGLANLLIAEDAGLDSFTLHHCLANNDISTCTLLFGGISDSTASSLSANYGFGLDDGGTNIDQAFLFAFDQPYRSGYFRLATEDNFCGTELEIDFVGGGLGGQPPSEVPEPSTYALLGIGLVAVGLAHRRARKKPA